MDIVDKYMVLYCHLLNLGKRLQLMAEFVSKMVWWWIWPVLPLLSFVAVGLIRRLTLKLKLMDQPNARSSHQIPVPIGGGLGIVLVFLVGMVFLYASEQLSPKVFWGLFVSGAGVALVGIADDMVQVRARWRLLFHFAFVGWFLLWTGGLPVLELSGMKWNLGWIGDIFSLFFLVWMLNLYNFMDGIDGIAGVEAITSAGTVSLLTGFMVNGSWQLPLILMLSTLGVLFWNWPPAKIFLGDVGSGFLGFILGALALIHGKELPELFWCWIILLGVFITDATFTLARRIIRMQRFYIAHRCHAYQYASRLFSSHRKVTISVFTINVCWLSPWALAVAFHWVDSILALMMAYLPLVVLAFRFKAGAAELQEV